MRKLFAIVQKEQMHAWCWGTCGKGLIGSIEIAPGLAAIPCAQPAEGCPHLDKDDTEPFGTSSFPGMVDDGPYEVWLRKLKELEST